MLTGGEILEQISGKPPLITGYRWVRDQIQPAGFDLSLADIRSVKSISETGIIDFSRAKSFFKEDLVSYGFSKPIEPFKPYILISKEEIHMPLDLTAICITRSSLTRLGAVLGSGIVDAGFDGHLAFSLISTLPIQFKQYDRFVQIIFFRHPGTFAYTGSYQENLMKQAERNNEPKGA